MRTEEHMGPDEKIPGGDLEMALLSALWEHAAAPLARAVSARELHGQVGVERGIVYTTVAKVLDRMLAKGMVARERAGRAYLYTPLVERGDTQRTMLRRMIAGVVGDDTQPAMAALVGALSDISPELLDQLTQELHKRRGGHDGT